MEESVLHSMTRRNKCKRNKTTKKRSMRKRKNNKKVKYRKLYFRRLFVMGENWLPNWISLTCFSFCRIDVLSTSISATFFSTFLLILIASCRFFSVLQYDTTSTYFQGKTTMTAPSRPSNTMKPR